MEVQASKQSDIDNADNNQIVDNIELVMAININDDNDEMTAYDTAPPTPIGIDDDTKNIHVNNVEDDELIEMNTMILPRTQLLDHITGQSDDIESEIVKQNNKLWNIPSCSPSPQISLDFDAISAPSSRRGTFTDHIHDVATPKMLKLRARISTNADEAEENDNEKDENQLNDEDVLIELQDLDEIKELSLNKIKKQQKIEKIVDENNEWLGYEISEKSILWKIYLYIDQFTPNWMLNLKVRANIYNSYFISELIVESWPQLVTNLVNSYYVGFSIISNISAVFSIIMIAYTMLKIIYYVGVRNKNLDKFVL